MPLPLARDVWILQVTRFVGKLRVCMVVIGNMWTFVLCPPCCSIVLSTVTRKRSCCVQIHISLVSGRLIKTRLLDETTQHHVYDTNILPLQPLRPTDNIAWQNACFFNICPFWLPDGMSAANNTKSAQTRTHTHTLASSFTVTFNTV